MSRNLPMLRSDTSATLCGICPDPGHCCREFYFHFSYWKDEGLEAAQRHLTQWGIPFTVLDWLDTYKDKDGREYAEILCNCPKVTAEGKCSIYKDRPGICRRYEAGSDPLCVFAGNSGLRFWNDEYQ